MVEGGYTIHSARRASGCSIYDAAMRYQDEGVPLVVLAGKEYGTGSSRDWAAKGTNLLGVRAVIAESFERIHRSNLVGMGVAPFVFEGDTSWASARPEGRRDHHHPRAWPATSSRASASMRKSPPPDGSVQERSARLPHRYARRARVLPQRRHPALRPAAVGGLSRFIRTNAKNPLSPRERGAAKRPDEGRPFPCRPHCPVRVIVYCRSR